MRKYMEYFANPLERLGLMQSSKKVAFSLHFGSPFPSRQDVFIGAQRYANEHGWAWTIDENPTYRRPKRVLGRGDYDGVIAHADPAMQRRLKRRGIPFVNVSYEYHRPGIAGAFTDVKAVGRLAAEHLMERGHRNLAALYFESGRFSNEMVQSFKKCVTDEQRHCTLAHYAAGGVRNAEFMIKLEAKIYRLLCKLPSPVGVLVDMPATARLVVDMCQQMGRSVPNDLALLCLVNLESVQRVEPQISAIDVNHTEIGYNAAKLLDRLMAGEPIPDEPVLLPPARIAARTSTDHFAVSDLLVAEAMRLISAGLKDKMRVEDLAYELAVSPSTLNNRFQKAFGYGVAAEMRRLRISAARTMLADPQLTLEHIAKEAGFANANTMGHILRREIGMSPLAYRESLQVDRLA